MREKLAALRQKIEQAKAASMLQRAALAGEAVDMLADLMADLVERVEGIERAK